MVESGKKKVSQKKKNKARQMWIEQFFLKLDALEMRVKTLEETVKYLSDQIEDIKRNGGNNV